MKSATGVAFFALTENDAFTVTLAMDLMLKSAEHTPQASVEKPSSFCGMEVRSQLRV